MKHIKATIGILFITLCFPLGICASQLNTPTGAKQKAKNFLSKKSADPKSKATFRSQNMEQELSLAKIDSGYCAFNIGNKEGFIIVSRDDRTNDIIGYSNKGCFDWSSMPYSMRQWIKSYSRAIANLPSGTARVEHKQREAIPEMLKTHWDQTGVYARQCPKVKNPDDPNSSEYDTPAGCVATAMAQIINYYRWPESLPALPEYTTSTLKIVRPALPATTINYDILRPVYHWEDNDESVDEMNKLLVYCGQSCEMDYTPMGSSSWIDIEKMYKYWGYTKKARSVNRSSYSTVEAWEDEIYQELAAGHPVLYAGVNNQEAHQFICDGYDGNGFFHLNFGWQGSDGFFDLSLCNNWRPDQSEYISDDGFVTGQNAILGLVPTTEDETDVQIEYDNREAVNGKIKVNSIESIGIARAHFYTLFKLNVTGLSDIEQTSFYIKSEGGTNMMTVYLKKDETRDVFVHARCTDPGLRHIVIAEDEDGSRVLAETDVNVIESKEEHKLTTKTEFPDMTNGIISCDYIKAILTITNEMDTPYDENYRLILLLLHEAEDVASEYRSFDTVLHLGPNETTKIEIVFNHIKSGVYVTNPFYWSINEIQNPNENRWITVSNTPVILGDVNGDGLVNVTDIVATVNYIMEKPSDNFNKDAADLNGDGLVNVTDIVKMVSIIMSGNNKKN